MEQTPKRPLRVEKATDKTSAWHSYLQTLKEEEPKRLEEAAKFLSGVISLSLTIFLGSGKEILVLASYPVKASNVLLWLISLLLAFMVLLPMPYYVVKESAESIEEMHKQSVRRKTYLLAASILCFLLALGILVWAYLVLLVEMQAQGVAG